MRPGRIEELPLGVPVQESTADAVLLIGDRAMQVAAEPFVAVGLWYRDFTPTTDDEVRSLLADGRAEGGGR